MNSAMNPKVLVLGSNSFSGADFVDLLLSTRPYKVLGVSRSAQKSPLFLPYLQQSAEKLQRFRFWQIDLNRQMPELLALLAEERPEYIVNFAAQSEVAPSWEHPEHWFQTNGVAIAALGNFLRQQPWLKRYVHISSPEVYGTCVGRVLESAPLNPSTPYAASKAAGDLMLQTLVKQFDFPLITIRATNVYGPHQQLFKIIPRTAIYLKSGRKIQLHGSGLAVKSYIHIRDVSRGELAAMEEGQTGELYHFSPAQGVAVREVVQQICTLKGLDFAQHTESVTERPGQDKVYVIDSSKARTAFGWRDEITLDQGLQEVIDWVEHYWSEIQEEPLHYVHKA